MEKKTHFLLPPFILCGGIVLGDEDEMVFHLQNKVRDNGSNDYEYENATNDDENVASGEVLCKELQSAQVTHEVHILDSYLVFLAGRRIL